MREILFRGKRLDNGEWVYGYLTVDDSRNPGFVIDYLMPKMSCYGQTEVDPETVGQYTGLRDKNSERIFEGDIVVFPPSYLEPKGVVIFSHGRFIVRATKTYILSEFVEVIGNIYDNPELLKGE